MWRSTVCGCAAAHALPTTRLSVLALPFSSARGHHSLLSAAASAAAAAVPAASLPPPAAAAAAPLAQHGRRRTLLLSANRIATNGLPLSHLHTRAASYGAEAVAAAAASAAPSAAAEATSATADAATLLPTFHFNDLVDSEESFQAFLKEWTRNPSPFLAPSPASASSPSPSPSSSSAAPSPSSSPPSPPVCVVALSGGVDSACTVLLALAARDAGIFSQVVAIHMRNWDEIEESGQCTGEKDQKDVMALCDSLGLELEIVDYSRDYFLDVFQPLLEGYKVGRTPSPDVLCNRVVKFALLLEHVRSKHGGDARLATGHYARIRHGGGMNGATADNHSTVTASATSSSSPSSSSPSPSSSTSSLLYAAVDPFKDQSYFLSSVPSSALRSCLFPLGHFHKPFIKSVLATSTWAKEVAERQRERVKREKERRRKEKEVGGNGAASAAEQAASSAPSAVAVAAPSTLPRSTPPPSTPLSRFSSKKESMGICFIGKRSMRDFLGQYITLHGGPMVDVETGMVLARHAGWEALTIGQKAAISGLKQKYYICGKTYQQVQRLPPSSSPSYQGSQIEYVLPAPVHSHPIYVCPGNKHPSLYFDDLWLEEMWWIAEEEPAELRVEASSVTGTADAAAPVEQERSMRVRVKVRSGPQQVWATLHKHTRWEAATTRTDNASTADGSASPSTSSTTSAVSTSSSSSPSAAPSPPALTPLTTYRVEFSVPQYSIAPGQACVIYARDGQHCLGEGQIQRAGLSYWQKRKQLPEDVTPPGDRRLLMGKEL